MNLRTLGAIVIFTLAPIANADTIELSNGDNISGNIISFKNGVCVFGTIYDSSLRLAAKDIKFINTDKEFTITFNNGDRITGYLKKSDNKQKITRSNISYDFNFEEVKDFDVTRERVNTLSTVEKKQEEYSAPISYLSDYTVLLNPGETDVDFGFKYRTYKSTSSLPLQGPYQVSSYSVKKLYFYVSPRFGVTENLSVWFNLPYTYTRIDDVSSNAWSRSAENGHVGDISTGVQYRILKESMDYPAITGSLSIGIPTGKKEFFEKLDSWKQPLNNSEGYWSITPAVSFVRIVDPVTFFGGISYEKTFETNKGREKIKVGDTASLYLGTGYSLNNISSFGSKFTYSWTDKMKYYGTTMKGTDSETELLSFYFSYLLSRKLSIMPEVTFPLDSTGTTVGVTMTKNF
ncbi:transporter [Pectobacterium polaris]|uniref:transporter n=1 Tax=Pectobacterium polaris TaxID=2042057 RepID=UPI001CF34019|nr:transporter [Pectobacterium polaris]MCA6952907.1 transporter [Pectobacterium polaris]